MKKLLLILLFPISLLIASEEKKEVNIEQFLYINIMTSNTNLTKNLFLPYYYGIGYRIIENKNGFDINLNIPRTIINEKYCHVLNSDISYLRKIDHKHYLIFGISNEYGYNKISNFYLFSPFFGIGKTFILEGCKMFFQLKINSFMYIPYINIKSSRPVNFKKDKYLKYSNFNFGLGFTF